MGIRTMSLSWRRRVTSGSKLVLGSLACFGAVAHASSIDYDLAALLGNNGFRFFSSGTGNNVGWRVDSIGDVNNDGFGDFATSGWSTQDPTVHIVFGRPGLGQTGLVDFNSIAPPFGWKVSGPFGDGFGDAISSLGDFNGDGFGDFAIGGPVIDAPGKSEAGRVYVIFGKATFGATQNSTIGTFVSQHGFSLVGASAGDRLGSSVAGGGDLNGDGFDDLIIGAPSRTASGKGLAGVAYVVFGGTGYAVNSVIDIGTLNPANSITVLGAAANDSLGRSAASTGDLNMDGLADAMIGAPGLDSIGFAGRVYGIFGGTTGVLDTVNPLTGSGFVTLGSLPGDMMGYRVAGLGDFNGDGPPDVAMSLPFADDMAANAGAIAILYGAPNLASTGFAFVNNFTGSVGARIRNTTADGSFGQALAGPGDLDGDGFTEIVTSDRSADPAGVLNAGRVFVVLGDTTIGNNGIFDINSIVQGSNGVTFGGVMPNDAIGISLGGALDVNNDGNTDLLIGSHAAKSLPAGHTGEVYVIKSLVPAPLTVDVHEMQATAGGVQKLAVNAGATHAGRYYYMLGSISGTTPGISLGGVPMALIPDSYFQFMLNYPNLIVANSLGILDPAGKGEGTLFVPAGVPAPFSNITLYHAYFVYDVPSGSVKMASNTVSLRIKP